MKSDHCNILTAPNEYIGIREFGGCTLFEYQRYLLGILKEIDRICRKNNIDYFLMYGTLLGAVRHSGFIPWDDDADVVMSRENYKRFAQCCKNDLSQEFDLLDYFNDEEYNYIFPRLRMKDTSFLIRSEISRHGRSAGFFVDIIIMDNYSDKKKKAFFQEKALLAMHRIVSPGFIQPVYGLNNFESGLVKITRFLLGRKKALRFFEGILSSAKRDESSKTIVGMLLPGSPSFQIVDNSHFDKGVDASFEGETFKIPHNALTLLTGIYSKKYISNNCALMPEYENEDEAIVSRQSFEICEMNYIPNSINRSRHLEVVFDSEHPSSYYDSNYYASFNKKKNDKAAIKERYYRTIGRNYLNIMNANESSVRASVRIQMGNEYFQRLMDKYPSYDDVPIKEAHAAIEFVIDVRAYVECDYNEQMYKYVIGLATRCEEAAVSKRMVKIYENNFGLDIERERVNAYKQEQLCYALYTRNIEKMEAAVTEDREDILTMCAKGILAYLNKNIVEAKTAFKAIEENAEGVFWSDFYLGCIELEEGKKFEAYSYLTKSINDTGYMPFIQMAIDKIKRM